MEQGFFITGTDTGVGKTWASHPGAASSGKAGPRHSYRQPFVSRRPGNGSAGTVGNLADGDACFISPSDRNAAAKGRADADSAQCD